MQIKQVTPLPQQTLRVDTSRFLSLFFLHTTRPLHVHARTHAHTTHAHILMRDACAYTQGVWCVSLPVYLLRSVFFLVASDCLSPHEEMFEYILRSKSHLTFTDCD